jgi:predicted DCC family thiol-disulfide oxidoreductase YuxK
VREALELTTLRKRWDRFWFEASSPDNLGLCRIILFGTMFLFYISTPRLFPSWGYHEDFTLWGPVSRVFWRPVWLMAVLHLPPVSAQVLEILQFVWRAALALSCIGLFTRISTGTSFILGLYLFGVPVSFGKIHHQEHVLIFSFFIMAFSRCSDAWSIDSLIRKARAGAIQQPAVLSAEYTWPVRMIWAVIALTYFAAGISKLRHSGFDWINSDNMSYFLTSSYYHIADAEPFTSWGLQIARSAMMSRMFAGIGVFLELSMIFTLFSRRSRWVLVPSVAAMQFGIAAMMGPNFYQMIICQLLWVPWDHVVARVTRPNNVRQKYTVLYDGACGLCKRTIGTIRGLDLFTRVECVDAVNDRPTVEKRFPGLGAEQYLTDMQVVTPRGKIYSGFYAYRSLAWILPLGWLALPVLYLPGVPSIGSRIYRLVAARRHLNSCPLQTRAGSTIAEVADVRDSH